MLHVQALGCLLYYLSFGKLPFGMENKLQILNGDFQMPTTRPAVLRQIIRQALTVKPSDRPSVDSILQQLEPLASSLGLAPAASEPPVSISPSTGMRVVLFLLCPKLHMPA